MRFLRKAPPSHPKPSAVESTATNLIPTKKTRVILVRHGRSTFNEQGRYQGSSNESILTEKGLKTARLVGQYLRKRSVDVVYASSLARVQQTSHEIIRAMAPDKLPPMIVSDHLKEISLAAWEGLTYQQVKQQFAAEYQYWQWRPHLFQLACVANSKIDRRQSDKGAVRLAAATYFPVQDLYQQAQQFWEKTLSRYTGSTILVVGHSGTNHALISTALGCSAEHHHSLQQSNCGVSLLEFSPQGARLCQLNQTVSLGEALPKLKAGKQGLRLILVAGDELIASDCQQISDRLALVPIDFCLAPSEAQPWTRLLLQHHPQTLQLETSQSDFLADWQQRLNHSSRQAEDLITGLVVAPSADIQDLLMQTLTGSVDGRDRLPLRHGRFSVIHYPHQHRPVVQAINI
jgi:phosphoserine phosphatase